MFSTLVSRFSRLFRCFRPPRRSHSNRPRRSHSNHRHRSPGNPSRVCIVKRAAFVIVYGRNSTILCLKGHSGKYELPGGSVKDYETPNQGARRELLEETSINTNLRNIIHICERPTRRGITRQYTELFYLTCYNPISVIISHEHRGYSWKKISWISNNLNRFTSYHRANLMKIKEEGYIV